MNILVAAGTLPRSRPVNHVLHAGPQVFRLVALLTLHRAVRPFQRKICGGMIKPLQFAPRLRSMASPATYSTSIRKQCHHPGGKLTFVRIFVTGGTSPLLEDVLGRPPCPESRRLAVTVGTDDGHVCSLQGKARRGMVRKRKCRRLESLLGMTGFATVIEGSAPELASVDIFVARETGHVRKNINNHLGSLEVALGARDFHMSSLQWKMRLCVLGDAEGRRFEAADLVTCRAIPTIGPRGKLTAMWVFLVTVCAVCERHRLLEIAASTVA